MGEIIIILVGVWTIFLIGKWILEPKTINRNPWDFPTYEQVMEDLEEENRLKKSSDLAHEEVEGSRGVGVGEGLFYFLFPIFGIFCAIVSRDSNPRRSKEAVNLVWASIMFAVIILILISI